jgi:hypothetical protein
MKIDIFKDYYSLIKRERFLCQKAAQQTKQITEQITSRY